MVARLDGTEATVFGSVRISRRAYPPGSDTKPEIMAQDKDRSRSNKRPPEMDGLAQGTRPASTRRIESSRRIRRRVRAFTRMPRTRGCMQRGLYEPIRLPRDRARIPVRLCHPH